MELVVALVVGFVLLCKNIAKGLLFGNSGGFVDDGPDSWLDVMLLCGENVPWDRSSISELPPVLLMRDVVFNAGLGNTLRSIRT